MAVDETTAGGDETTTDAIADVLFRAIHQGIPTPRSGGRTRSDTRTDGTAATRIACRSTTDTKTGTTKGERTYATTMHTIPHATVAIDRLTAGTIGASGRKRSTRASIGRRSESGTTTAIATWARMARTGETTAVGSLGRSDLRRQLNSFALNPCGGPKPSMFVLRDRKQLARDGQRGVAVPVA